MLIDRPENIRSARLLVPLLILSLSISFIIYEWDEFILAPISHVLPLSDNFLSTPPVDNEATKPTGDVNPENYNQVFSVSTDDRKYFFVDFVDLASLNPSILPHPSLKETWIITAQRLDSPEVFHKHPMEFAEITCNAAFQSGVLRCLESPSILPVNTIQGDKCEGNHLLLNVNTGPHDARVFYGPESAFTIYGSNSNFTCFGQFIHNYEALTGWENFTSNANFEIATELQRPPPYGKIEKNWFVFWDRDGAVYAHYDISPRRSFAKVGLDGSVGEDLASAAALAGDDICMAKYMPRIGPEWESIHQATNSLSVTLCKRSDVTCEPNDTNTFIMAIFQHKNFWHFHSVYEPYVVLFGQSSPFKIHGISQKPFWIHGRWGPDAIEGDRTNVHDPAKEETGGGAQRNELGMLYVTSMNWKAAGQKYHGYVDDVVFLGFGIEDAWSGGIDLAVGDLLMDLGIC